MTEPAATPVQIQRTEADSIISAAMALGVRTTDVHPIEPGSKQAWMVPAGYRVEVVDARTDAATPARAVADVRLRDTASFIAYVDEMKVANSKLYASPESLDVLAVINDHGPGAPGWRDFTAQLILRTTDAWRRWTSAHGRYLAQDEFAELIDDGIAEIASPPGADLLEMAQTIKVSSSAAFRSQKILKTGQVQFSYVEELDGKAGADGQLTIPSTITLSLAPFDGADNVLLTARLRYRLVREKLTLGIWLANHPDVLRHAFDLELLRIESQTGLLTLVGAP